MVTGVSRCSNVPIESSTQPSGLDGPYRGPERLEKKKPVICAIM